MNALTLDQVEQNFKSLRIQKKYKGEAIPGSLKEQIRAVASKHKKNGTVASPYLQITNMALATYLTKKAG